MYFDDIRAAVKYEIDMLRTELSRVRVTVRKVHPVRGRKSSERTGEKERRTGTRDDSAESVILRSGE